MASSACARAAGISSSTKFSRDVLWLRGQIHRAAASISSNIAEGAGQETSAQFGRCLVIALASSNELSNHDTLARDLGHWPDHVFVQVEDEIEAIRAMLIVLLRRIREREGRMVNEPERGQSEVNASVDPDDMTAH